MVYKLKSIVLILASICTLQSCFNSDFSSQLDLAEKSIVNPDVIPNKPYLRRVFISSIILSTGELDYTGSDNNLKFCNTSYPNVPLSSDPIDKVARANCFCSRLAAAAGLSSNYSAWLSDGSSSAKCNIINQKGNSCSQTQSKGPYKLVGTDALVYSDIKSLIDLATLPATIINRDENGQVVVSSNIFTGSLNSGLIASKYCHDGSDSWSTNSSLTGYEATIGDLSNTSNWTNSGTISCDQLARIYCFEHP